MRAGNYRTGVGLRATPDFDQSSSVTSHAPLCRGLVGGQDPARVAARPRRGSRSIASRLLRIRRLKVEREILASEKRLVGRAEVRAAHVVPEVVPGERRADLVP